LIPVADEIGAVARGLRRRSGSLENRRLLLDRVDQAMKEARHRRALAAVLFLDLDNFKQTGSARLTVCLGNGLSLGAHFLQ
jgi:hypothetical protein